MSSLKDSLYKEQNELLQIKEMQKTLGGQLFREILIDKTTRSLSDLLEVKSTEWSSERIIALVSKLQSMFNILKTYDGIDEKEKNLDKSIREIVEKK